LSILKILFRRTSVAYDPQQKLWITVGPNGTDISHDDGKNWTALKPTAKDPPDADKNWNALSLPFVVGPHGRIGKLNAKTLAPLLLSNCLECHVVFLSKFTGSASSAGRT
jgi:hypothetical protein